MILSEAGPGPVPVPPVAEFAEHLRLGLGFPDDGSEDALLERYLRSAVGVVERRIAQALVARRFEVRVSEWTREGLFLIPIGPVRAIVEANIERGGSATPLSVLGWTVSAGPTRQVLSANGMALPAIPPGGTVRVLFDAGLADDWDGVPGDLKQAVLLLAAEYYERRGTETVAETGLPGPVTALLAQRRPVRL